jgi:hypothetical protein
MEDINLIYLGDFQMDKELKSVISVSLLFTFITASCSFIGRLGQLFTSAVSIKALEFFFTRNLLWIIAVTAIIAVLIYFSRKLKMDIRADVFENQIVCLVAGILVTIDGVMNISSFIPIFIFSIQSLIDTTHTVSLQMDFIVKNIATNASSLMALLLQIIAGVYFVKRYKIHITKE